MAGGKLFPEEAIPEGYFAGQKHITREPDDYPDLWQLLNSLRKVGGAKQGEAKVTAGVTSEAVVFGTAFPTGTTVRVLVTPRATPGAGSVWVTAESETGFTANIVGILGTDVDYFWIAFGA